jgi:C4-dicarboxylate transporter DctM subunit
MTPIEYGIIGCVGLVVLLIASMPVAFSMSVIGVVGFACIVNPHAAYIMLASDFFDTFADYNMTVIPLFVLMGQVAFHSGISRRLFDAAYHWFGPLPGGLAMATVGACTAFGAICGSGPATAATMASVALPEMRRYGYSMELATGTVASGGSIGMLIPPSVVFIVYAIMTQGSIQELFIAGVLPGLMIALMFCIQIYIQCKLRPELGPAAPSTTWGQKFRSLSGITETLILFIAVMGGMFIGVFTPTEAAAMGAVGTVIIAMIRRNITFKLFNQAMRETLRTSCMVMAIIAGARVFGHFLAITQIPYELATWLSTLPLPAFVVMGFIIVFYLIAGCFVDALALVLLTVPIFAPVVEKLGYHSILFGVIIVVVTQMGVISPPVGVNVYVVSGIARDVPLQTVFRGSMPFLLTLVIASVILVAFPQISLFLPNLMH